MAGNVDFADLMSRIVGIHSLQKTDRTYTFYYDETNNIRRLHLTDTGFNEPDPACFLVGGIGHDGPPRSLGLDALRPKLYLQPNMTEIKLKYLGKGDFLSLLKSQKIVTMLEWIESEGVFIHYQVTDPLYWSIVDIIDSIAADGKIAIDFFELRALKNTLYALLREDLNFMSDLMTRYDYPNVGIRQQEFLDELIKLVELHLETINEDDLQGHFLHMMLKGVLQAGRAEALVFLTDEEPRLLIKEFGFFFANRLQTFAQSNHILDEEHLVGDFLKNGALGRQILSYRFANSKDEVGIQQSDVVVGLLGKAFTYCTHHSIEEIECDLQKLSDHQSRALTILARILDRSMGRSNAFGQRILSDEDEAKAALLFAYLPSETIKN